LFCWGFAPVCWGFAPVLLGLCPSSAGVLPQSPLGELQHSPRPLAAFNAPTSKGRDGKAEGGAREKCEA